MSTKQLWIAIGIPLGVLAFVALPWVAMFIYWTVLSPNPPMPEIRYGEFPFRLEYELNGESFIVEDTLICEFDGVWNSGMGKYLQWKMRLLSGDVLTRFGGLYRITGAYEWKSHGVVRLFDDANSTIGSIYCDIGNPQYYLGYNILSGYSPGIVFSPRPEIIADDVLWDQYQIRIIKAEFSQPMEGNSIVIKAP